MNPKRWPNLITATRMALTPAVLMVAVAGSKPWFVSLITATLLTDALDGYLARRLNARSDLGRKLDSAADYLTLTIGLAGIALLWPDIMRREMPWIVAALASFFAVIVVGFGRLGRAPCYHTWISKFGVVGCALSLIPLLSGGTAGPFHALTVLQVIGGVEELLIVLLVPWHTGEMPTLWHAWRLRRTGRPALPVGGAARR
ncbi:MAG: CDP-alcohol phosphatidyltransferase family protein [Verrucomicrobiota bacterium]|jgi:phosphatidylglycerophosphate synthase